MMAILEFQSLVEDRLVLSLLAIFALLINATYVILFFTKYRGQKPIRYYFLLNLAVIHLLQSLCLLIRQCFMKTANQLTENNFVCVTWNFTRATMTEAGYITLAVVTALWLKESSFKSRKTFRLFQEQRGGQLPFLLYLLAGIWLAASCSNVGFFWTQPPQPANNTRLLGNETVTPPGNYCLSLPLNSSAVNVLNIVLESFIFATIFICLILKLWKTIDPGIAWVMTLGDINNSFCHEKLSFRLQSEDRRRAARIAVILVLFLLFYAPALVLRIAVMSGSISVDWGRKAIFAIQHVPLFLDILLFGRPPSRLYKTFSKLSFLSATSSPINKADDVKELTPNDSTLSSLEELFPKTSRKLIDIERASPNELKRSKRRTSDSIDDERERKELAFANSMLSLGRERITDPRTAV